jgi:uncharacterized protein (UPF0332 family)
MKPEIAALIKKAERSIASAKLQAANGYFDFAAARAYYAMFYAAEALPHSRGLQFSSHGAVHAAFGKEFIKSGQLDAKFHRALLEAFRQRQEADYNTEPISLQAAEEIIRDAEAFFAAAQQSGLLKS